MSTTAKVVQAAIVDRPDDKRRLCAVITDGREANSGSDSFYIEPDGPIPPDDVEVTWHGHVVTWQLPDGTQETARKVGESYDSGIEMEKF